mgnify:CR=1 FL=1
MAGAKTVLFLGNKTSVGSSTFKVLGTVVSKDKPLKLTKTNSMIRELKKNIHLLISLFS